MRHNIRRSAPVVLVLGMLLSACAAPVTYHGQAITDEVTVNAAQAISAADRTSAAIVRFLITGNQNNLIPDSVLDTYETEIGPALQAALDTSRNGLQRAIDNPSSDATEKLLTHTATLMEVLNQAIVLAARYGW